MLQPVRVRPRKAVLEEAWLAAELDCPRLSGADGRPLARTVKCLIDPLVVRPRQHPELGRPMLDETAASRLTQMIEDHRELLQAADGWYALLRDERRARAIRDGNPQELYFPRAWELAHRCGDPAQRSDVADLVVEMITEVHPSGQLDLESVVAVFDDPTMAAHLAERISAGWDIEVVSESDARAAIATAARAIAELLDEGPDDDAQHTEALADAAVTLGRVARQRAGVLAELGLATGMSDDLQVSDHDPLVPPPIDDPVTDRTVTDRTVTDRGTQLPLDRSLRARVLLIMKRSRDREAWNDATELVADEADRIGESWGLTSPHLQGLLLAGVVMSRRLDPLGVGDELPADALALTRVIDLRLKKEAYVLHVRRLLADGAPIHPRQAPVVDTLREFWRPYLARLWVRLHGRDVTGTLDSGEDHGVRDLLTGVARSVSLDQRTRIRHALERAA